MRSNHFLQSRVISRPKVVLLGHPVVLIMVRLITVSDVLFMVGIMREPFLKPHDIHMRESWDSIVNVVWTKGHVVGSEVWIFCFDPTQFGFQGIQRNRSVRAVDPLFCHDSSHCSQLFKVSIVSLPCEIIVSMPSDIIYDFIHISTPLLPLCLSELVTILMLLMITLLQFVLSILNKNFLFFDLQFVQSVNILYGINFGWCGLGRKDGISTTSCFQFVDR